MDVLRVGGESSLILLLWVINRGHLILAFPLCLFLYLPHLDNEVHILVDAVHLLRLLQSICYSAIQATCQCDVFKPQNINICPIARAKSVSNTAPSCTTSPYRMIDTESPSTSRTFRTLIPCSIC